MNTVTRQGKENAMTKTRSTADPLAKCRGQAMVETAIGLVVFVFVTAALVSFATLFL